MRAEGDAKTDLKTAPTAAAVCSTSGVCCLTASCLNVRSDEWTLQRRHTQLEGPQSAIRGYRDEPARARLQPQAHDEHPRHCHNDESAETCGRVRPLLCPNKASRHRDTQSNRITARRGHSRFTGPSTVQHVGRESRSSPDLFSHRLGQFLPFVTGRFAAVHLSLQSSRRWSETHFSEPSS